MRKMVEVTRTAVQCEVLTCDMCGRIAEYPGIKAFSCENEGKTKNRLILHQTDGLELYMWEELDLCPDCGARLAQAIRDGTLKDHLEDSK